MNRTDWYIIGCILLVMALVLVTRVQPRPIDEVGAVNYEVVLTTYLITYPNGDQTIVTCDDTICN